MLSEPKNTLSLTRPLKLKNLCIAMKSLLVTRSKLWKKIIQCQTASYADAVKGTCNEVTNEEDDSHRWLCCTSLALTVTGRRHRTYHKPLTMTWTGGSAKHTWWFITSQSRKATLSLSLKDLRRT